MTSRFCFSGLYSQNPGVVGMDHQDRFTWCCLRLRTQGFVHVGQAFHQTSAIPRPKQFCLKGQRLKKSLKKKKRVDGEFPKHSRQLMNHMQMRLSSNLTWVGGPPALPEREPFILWIPLPSLELVELVRQGQGRAG